MPRIEKYVLLTSETDRDLMSNVNGLIKGGWQPLGGPFGIHANAEDAGWFAQALVLYGSSDPALSDEQIATATEVLRSQVPDVADF